MWPRLLNDDGQELRIITHVRLHLGTLLGSCYGSALVQLALP